MRYYRQLLRYNGKKEINAFNLESILEENVSIKCQENKEYTWGLSYFYEKLYELSFCFPRGGGVEGGGCTCMRFMIYLNNV